MHSLHTSLEEQRKNIAYLGADQIRVLVRVPINLMHNNDQVAKLCNKKIIGCADSFSTSMQKLNDISFSYQHYWQLSLKHLSLVLSLNKDHIALSRLHIIMLLKLGVMRTFLVIIRNEPIFLGRLSIQLLKLEAIAKATHHQYLCIPQRL